MAVGMKMRFAKKLRLQLDPLYEATSEVAKQNLDFEVGHSNIKEFEDVLLSFSHMKESLKASLEQQWEAEHMQKEQIAALAHDLKTPLTVIQGNADLISETELDEEQRLYAEYISSSSEQMQLYIRTLIDISRAASGYQLHMEDIDVLSYVEQLRGQIDALCQTKKIGLQMELEHLPDVLSADKLLLERAIMNVINNAMDYSPQDSSIHISIIGGKQHLKITVTDAGPGFSQEDLLHAKEQFYMADHSRSSNMHFGMGLFITKSIVQQHGGQLDLYYDSFTTHDSIGVKRKLRFRSFNGYLKEEERNVRPAEHNEILELLKQCTNCRDQLLIMLLAETGYRIGEILGVDYTRDIDYERHTIRVFFRDDNENRARAKNAAYRKAKISDATFQFLLFYLSKYRELLQHQQMLFVNIEGETKGKALQVDAVYRMLERMEKKTGIHTTPHMLRRYFGNMRRDAGWPLEMISEAYGHKHTDTTIKYLNIVDDQLMEASDQYYAKHSVLYDVEKLL